MMNISKPLLTAFGVSLAGVLAGCASVGTAPAPTPPSQIVSNGSVDEKEMITGSRVPRKTTEQMLRRIGASGAKEMDRERPPSPGPAVQ
jgi:hypothetical protein